MNPIPPRRFAVAALILLGLLPIPAEGQGSIGPLPLQHLASFGGFRGSGVTSFQRAGDLAFFTVSGPYTFESLWWSDGTAAGTSSFGPTGVPGSWGVRFWTTLGTRSFFTKPRSLNAQEPGRDLWRSDGTVAGTIRLSDGLSLAVDVSAGDAPTALGVPEAGLVFFAAGAESEQPDFELWATDGTPEGTRFVKDIHPGGPSNPGSMVAFDGKVFFVAETPAGPELWSSDGTEEGTVRVPEIPSLPIDRLAATGRHLFLSLAEGKELWAMDGDTGEVVRVAASTQRLDPFAAGDGVVFHLRDDHGLEPWWSDGTPEGTRRIADLCPGPCDSSPEWIGTWAGRALLRADDGVSGPEPWITDGTAEGTYRLGDLCPGACSSYISEGREVNGWVVLLEGDGDTFWMSDGTEDGTFPVRIDVYSIATAYLALDDRILVATYTPALAGGLIGQLWSMPVTAPLPPPGEWLASERVPGFRFKVRIAGISGRQEPACLAETLCVSGALPGRSEVFLRLVGPKPNGRLWPTLVKFSTSLVEVWVQQTATGGLRHYRLAASGPSASILPGVADREGFLPWSDPDLALEAETAAPPPPGIEWIESAAIPGFRFKVRLTSGSETRGVRKEPCISETLCLSGAVAGRSELFVRIVGPKPNGHLWPTLVRFTTSTVEVWIEQKKTGIVRYYRLEAPPRDSSDLSGLFDKQGFRP